MILRRAATVMLLASTMLLLLRDAYATNLLTDAPNTPRGEVVRWQGFELGPMLSLPLPIAGASREQGGLSAGLSFTVKTEQSGGFGADVAYHYWPVSPKMKQAFDSYLRAGSLNILRTGAGTWELDVIQYGFHVQHRLPGVLPTQPWLRVGVNVYRVDPNISGYSGDAGLFTVVAGPLRTTNHLGGSLGVGSTLLTRRSTRFGLDAQYHWLPLEGLYGDDLHVLSLGAHARFGK